MSHWCIGLIAASGAVVLLYVLLPRVLLRLCVLIYPKDHTRRREFVAELKIVPFFKRPFWTTGMLIRCLSEGIPTRARSVRATILLKLKPQDPLTRTEISTHLYLRSRIKEFGPVHLAQAKRDIEKYATKTGSTDIASGALKYVRSIERWRSKRVDQLRVKQYRQFLQVVTWHAENREDDVT